jgi:hypothetical protein
MKTSHIRMYGKFSFLTASDNVRYQALDNNLSILSMFLPGVNSNGSPSLVLNAMIGALVYLFLKCLFVITTPVIIHNSYVFVNGAISLTRIVALTL